MVSAAHSFGVFPNHRSEMIGALFPVSRGISLNVRPVIQSIRTASPRDCYGSPTALPFLSLFELYPFRQAKRG
ncbi:MAG: hypothetical protein RLZZ26_80 [Candidatus Parcubacteria bacterium]|jgi:hypothetical protein